MTPVYLCVETNEMLAWSYKAQIFIRSHAKKIFCLKNAKRIT
jgi:hypothetical protein